MSEEGFKDLLKKGEMRGILALVFVLTFCILALRDKIPVDDVVKVTLFVSGFYFGTKVK